MDWTSCLPAELLYQIVDDATLRGSHLWSLRRLSLVSRRWHHVVLPLMYKRWSHDGHQHSILSMWHFLRTLLNNKRIADAVKEVDLSNWILGLVQERGPLRLTGDDLDLIRRGIDMLRPGDSELIESSFARLAKADPTPLVTLILASLPNLATFSGQLPKGTDELFMAMLHKGIEAGQQGSDAKPLGQLRDVTLSGTWVYHEYTPPNYWAYDPGSTMATLEKNHNHWRRDYELPIDDYAVFLQLPNVQKVALFDAKISRPGRLERLGIQPRSLALTDLTLVQYHGIPESALCHLLGYPQALTKVSIHLVSREELGTNQPSNSALWSALDQHRDSLETLDFYRASTFESELYPVLQSPCLAHLSNGSHFASLRGFKRLRYLRIQPEVLLGGCCGGEVAPFRLHDTLPTTLESLTLYGNEGLVTNKTLARQLQQAFSSGAFSQLTRVTLERISRDLAHPKDRPHNKVRQVCRDHGVRYAELEWYICLKGGDNRAENQHLWMIRNNMGQRMKDIQYGVSEYIIRKRREERENWERKLVSELEKEKRWPADAGKYHWPGYHYDKVDENTEKDWSGPYDLDELDSYEIDWKTARYLGESRQI